MFSFPPQVLGVAKVLALENRSSAAQKDLVSSAGPRLKPADARKRDFCSERVRVEVENDRSLVHAPTSGAAYETEKLFSPPKFRRSPTGSEDLFARRRKEF